MWTKHFLTLRATCQPETTKWMERGSWEMEEGDFGSKGMRCLGEKKGQAEAQFAPSAAHTASKGNEGSHETCDLLLWLLESQSVLVSKS